MSELMSNAHINLLFTFQNTGIKLKLLNSLYRGRFCLVNSKMVNYTGLERLCVVEDNPNAAKRDITSLMNAEFSMEDIEKRKRVLDAGFGNEANALKIAKEMFF